MRAPPAANVGGLTATEPMEGGVVRVVTALV